MHQQITIQVHCHNLPGTHFDKWRAVRLGIQKGQEVVDDVPADTPQVTFTVPVRIEKHAKTGQPNFLGHFAHGTPQERFIYLNWGERKDGAWDGFRRLKIHLKHLTWEQVEEAIQNNKPIEFSIDMTDERGGPACGSFNLHQASSSCFGESKR